MLHACAFAFQHLSTSFEFSNFSKFRKTYRIEVIWSHLIPIRKWLDPNSTNPTRPLELGPRHDAMEPPVLPLLFHPELPEFSARARAACREWRTLLSMAACCAPWNSMDITWYIDIHSMILVRTQMGTSLYPRGYPHLLASFSIHLADLRA